MPANRPNIVGIICHDLGRRLGCYGDADVRSPNIDSLASDGLRFENAFCTAPQCSPARAALWTGRYPHATGVVGLTHGGFRNDLNKDEVHLAARLKRVGYHTAGFGHLHEARTHDHLGFDHIERGGNAKQPAEWFERWLVESGGTGGKNGVLGTGREPFFAELSFFEPHRPFPRDGFEPKPHDTVTPLPYLPDLPVIREDLADMEASIATMDAAVGRVLRALEAADVAENTLVFFTADHGIPFVRAKMSLYDPGIEVPLIFRGPDVPSGETCADLVSHVDLVPTLMEHMGISDGDAVVGNRLHGRSFAPRLFATEGARTKDAAAGAGDAVFAEKTYHTYYDPMRCIRTPEWKLIANFEFAPSVEISPDPPNNAKSYWETITAMQGTYPLYHPPLELYDLSNDPLEKTNLVDEDGLAVDAASASVLRDLVARLWNWMKETRDPLVDGPVPQACYLERRRLIAEAAGA